MARLMATIAKLMHLTFAAYSSRPTVAQLQIPMQTLSVNVSWGGRQLGPYHPLPSASITLGERWQRDLEVAAPTVQVLPFSAHLISWAHARNAEVSTLHANLRFIHCTPLLIASRSVRSSQARLLYRRDMLELYLDDYLFPVYAFPATTGRLGVTNASSVTAVQLWKMTLPGSP